MNGRPVPDPGAAAARVRRAFERTPRARELASLARERGLDLHLAGGFVRDVLLGGADPRDLDFAVSREGTSLASAWAAVIGGSVVPLDTERGTFRVAKKLEGRLWFWDFTALRAPDLDADLRLRDFTVNALALSLNPPTGLLGDPTGGLADLGGGIIRHTHAGAFTDDPLRKLRAYRLAAQLGFAIHPATAALLPGDDLAATVSGERIREELGHLLASPRSALQIRRLVKDGILASCWPPPGPDVELLTGLEDLVARMNGSPGKKLPAFLHHTATHGLARLVLLKLVCLAFPAGEGADGCAAAQPRLSYLGKALIVGWAAARFQALALAACSLLLDRQSFLATPEGPWAFFDRYGPGGLGGIVLRSLLLPPAAGLDPEPWAAFFAGTYLPDLKREKLLSAEEVSRLSGLAPGPGLGRLLDRLNLARRLGKISDTDQARAYLRSILSEGCVNPEDSLHPRK